MLVQHVIGNSYWVGGGKPLYRIVIDADPADAEDCHKGYDDRDHRHGLGIFVRHAAGPAK